MSNLRNDPTGHYELGLRIEIEKAEDRAWAAFAQALLEDAVALSAALIREKRLRRRAGRLLAALDEPRTHVVWFHEVTGRGVAEDLRAVLEDTTTVDPTPCPTCPHPIELHNADGSCGCGMNCAKEEA